MAGGGRCLRWEILRDHREQVTCKIYSDRIGDLGVPRPHCTEILDTWTPWRGSKCPRSGWQRPSGAQPARIQLTRAARRRAASPLAPPTRESESREISSL